VPLEAWKVDPKVGMSGIQAQSCVSLGQMTLLPPPFLVVLALWLALGAVSGPQTRPVVALSGHERVSLTPMYTIRKSGHLWVTNAPAN
jgi:hypothetical protein